MEIVKLFQKYHSLKIDLISLNYSQLNGFSIHNLAGICCYMEESEETISFHIIYPGKF